jgi:peroxiredoxin
MKPIESPVSEEAGTPAEVPEPVSTSTATAAPEVLSEPDADSSPPQEHQPRSPKLTSRKVLLLALGLIFIVIFSGWLTERRVRSAGDVVDGQLSVAPVGETAPDFKLKSTDGREIRLSDYRGRPVIVAFWATWCGPCLYEMPELLKFYQKEGGKVDLLAVSLDDEEEDAKGYAHYNRLPFPVLYDGTKRVAAGYAVDGIPAIFVVGPDGAIRAHHVGLISSLDTVLESEVEVSRQQGIGEGE